LPASNRPIFVFIFDRSATRRVAGLAVLLYMANSNFLYWSAQFSYESLSLPLGILVLFILVKRGKVEDKQLKRGLTLVMVLLITAIVVTHHVTSYALVIFLIVLSTVYSYLQVHNKSKQSNTWGFTILAFGLTLSWLVLVADPTMSYLYQIFKPAFASLKQVVTGEETGRALFTSTAGVVAPSWERLIGISSVLLIVLGILSGLFALWKRKKLSPFAIVLAGIALLYFITLGLRLTGSGWEIANRASEFLFVNCILMPLDSILYN
jgi:uncharacterized membrane protein HdeD (DUF308 family)